MVIRHVPGIGILKLAPWTPQTIYMQNSLERIFTAFVIFNSCNRKMLKLEACKLKTIISIPSD